MLNMTSFDKRYFESSPPEGLYNIDIGMSGMSDFGHIQTFADMNSDKYTDMVNVLGGTNTIQIHCYDSLAKIFSIWKEFKVEGCVVIRNIAVGRSSQTMRLFVTCDNGSNTILKLVDRVKVANSLNDEVEFLTLPFSLAIEAESQPFVGDLNGDYLDDIMYTEQSALIAN